MFTFIARGVLPLSAFALLTPVIAAEPVKPAAEVKIREAFEPEHVAALVNMLRDADARARARAYAPLREMRQTGIAHLLVLAASKGETLPERSAKHDAIRLLGEWRVSDAAEMLVDQIEYSPREVVTRPSNPLSEFPAGEALVEIGNPVPQKIIDRLWKPVSDQQLKLYAFVLYMIDGRQLALARLEMALAKASEEALRSAEYAKPKKENLSRLIRVLRDTDFSNRKERPRPPWVRRGGSAERKE